MTGNPLKHTKESRKVNIILTGDQKWLTYSLGKETVTGYFTARDTHPVLVIRQNQTCGTTQSDKGSSQKYFYQWGKKNQVDKAVKFLFLSFCVFSPVQSVLPCARCDWAQGSDTLQWKMSGLPHPVHRCEQQLSVSHLYMLKGYHLNSVQKNLLTKTLSLNGTSK